VRERALHGELGLLGATLSGVGIILGAGIYVIIGEAAVEAGSAVWLSFLIAAAVAGATAFSYAELASMFPEAGASSVYAREAFGRRIGFLTGWLRIAIDIISSAAVALGFGGYLGDLVGLPTLPLAIGVVLVATAIVIIGLRETVAVAVTMTLIEAGGLLVVVAVGLPEVGTRSLFDAPHGFMGIVAGAALVFFAFEGFEQIATLAEETRDPTRTIPRAILLAVGSTAALYVLVAITAVSALEWPLLAQSSSPMADAVRAVAHHRLGDALSTVALFATGNTVLMMIATGSRLSYGMSRRGLLPPFLGTVQPQRGTPWIAALAVGGLAAVFTIPGDLGVVVQVSNFAVFVAFVVVNAAVTRLRWTRPEVDRPFRIAGAIGGIPVTAVLGTFGAIGLSFSMQVEAVVVGFGVLLSGLLVSPIAMRKERPEASPDGERSSP